MRRLLCLVLLLPVIVLPARADAADSTRVALDDGYRLMYGLDFGGADERFLAWERAHPDDPLASVSRAANLLFRELDRLGVLQTRFFEDNSFQTRSKRAPDRALEARFRAALEEAEGLARARYESNPRDRDALFSLTLVYGLRADYASLVEGRNLASLSFTRQATGWATILLSVDPSYYDAYLAVGISHYIVGSLPAPVRWIFRAAGYRGDKDKGIEELRLTAEHGRFLGPFARLLLAVAYLREGDRRAARLLLEGLQRDFPSNPLFAREVERLGGSQGSQQVW